MLQKLKDLQAKLDTLTNENKSLKDGMESSIADLEKQIEESANARKVTDTDTVSDADVEKAVVACKAAYIKSVATGKPLSAMAGFKEASAVIEKALTPADVPNWVAEAFSSDVIEKVELELKVAGLFDKITIPNGFGSISIPVRTGDLTAYLIQPAADAIASVISDGKITFATTKIKTLTVLSDENNEELVAAVLSLSEKELVSSLVRAIEKSIVMGDTAIADANDVRKSYDGLLKLGNVNSVDAGGDALVLADVASARVKMGVLGINPTDVAIIMNPNTYLKSITSIPEILTMDKVGDKATIVTGQLGSLLGMPIVVTETIPNTLTVAGADTGAGTKAAVVLVSRSSFLRAGRVDGVVSEADRNIVNDTNSIVAKVSVDFKSVAASGEVAVVSIINVG